METKNYKLLNADVYDIWALIHADLFSQNGLLLRKLPLSGSSDTLLKFGRSAICPRGSLLKQNIRLSSADKSAVRSQ
jgi:hypothetical protein